MPLDDDAVRVRHVREAIGHEVELMIDANTSYRPREAVALWGAVRDAGVAWFEEPTSFDDLDGARFVADRVDCPVAGYETEGTAAGFRELIARRVIDIAQPDVTWCGGITEARRIVALAEAAGLAVTMHAFGSAVGFFANLHMLAAVSKRMRMELDITENPLRDELTDPSPNELVQRGSVSLPEAPGLGTALRSDALEEFGAT